MNASTSVSTFTAPPLRNRLRVAASAMFDLARDPGRLDRVFDLGEALNAARIPEVLDRIAADPAGKRLLDEQPRIDTKHVDFDALRALPEGTLGREYTRFLDTNGISADVFQPPSTVTDARVSYIMLRIRQTHDLWHVLTGYTPDVAGEVLLQAFTYAQLGAPSALAITIVGTLRHGRKTPRFGRRLVSALRRGKRAKKLATFYWEDHWGDSLADLRAKLACAPERAS
jgi:ubiquinone biosynthesis protein COQ4